CDDNNNVLGAGTMIRAADDRFFFIAVVTNGMDDGFPNTQMDDYPGVNIGFWYDFGGSWDSERRRWQLYGDSMPDIDYTSSPTIRVGADTYISPLDRRSLYGDDEQSRIFVMPSAPQGGTRLINVLNGDAATPKGAHAVDEFDYYT